MKKAKKQAKIISCIMLVLLSCALLAPCLAGCGSDKAATEIAAQPKIGVMVDGSFVTIGTVLPEDLDYVADVDSKGIECTYLDIGPIEGTPGTGYLKGLFENVLQVDMDGDEEKWSMVGMIRINSAADHPLVTSDGIELKNASSVSEVLGAPTLEGNMAMAWEVDGLYLGIVEDETGAIISYSILKR